MRLDYRFLKLPRIYCAETLAREIGALPQSAWVPHPGRLPGNDAVLLVSPGGGATNGFAGPMAPTEHLLACPYLMEVMEDLGAVWGRSRLMGLAPSAPVPAHVDVHYHWRTHIRIHIPIITNPRVLFTCDDETVHMSAGECWLFDSFRMHNVHNGGAEKRVHLVLDTVGGEGLWDLTQAARAGDAEVKHVSPTGRPVSLAYEQVNMPRVMSPWEVRSHIDYLAVHVARGDRSEVLFGRLDRFIDGWTAAWAQFGDSDGGIPVFRRLISDIQAELASSGRGDLKLDNQVPISRALDELIFHVAISPNMPGIAPVPASGLADAPAHRIAS